MLVTDDAHILMSLYCVLYLLLLLCNYNQLHYGIYLVDLWNSKALAR